jgi:hypothetical protein
MKSPIQILRTCTKTCRFRPQTLALPRNGAELQSAHQGRSDRSFLPPHLKIDNTSEGAPWMSVGHVRDCHALQSGTRENTVYADNAQFLLE